MGKGEYFLKNLEGFSYFRRFITEADRLFRTKQLDIQMKTLLAILSLGLLAFAGASRADDQAAAVKPYTLDYCVFSGDKLGTMGKVTSEVYKGQEIKFCCGQCKKQFDKDPDAGLKKYEDAVKAKSSSGDDKSMGK